MCGIAGAIWNDAASAVGDDALGRMSEALRHRGPDGAGSWQLPFRPRSPYPPQPGLGLAHRRLAIIDVAGGRQPLANENDTVWLVFNGEIYNHRALRQRLEGSGHRFRTRCDAETLVHLYEDEGLNAFEHLNGMFALALYDVARGRLVLARDRLGKKPLVYHHTPQRLLFASELKALVASGCVPTELDPGAIDEYLTYQYIPHPNTIYRDVKKLPPGHYAVWENGELKVERWWRLDANAERELPTEEYARQLRDLFRSSVELRLESDVPVGAFLSGGIDSSLVVAQMQQLRQEPVSTFTIGFGDAEYDESAAARELARVLGTRHEEFRVEPNAAEVLPQLIECFDEPFADSSALPTWYVARLTAQHVKVALTGDGGDELFAGYERYRAVSLAAAIDRLGPVRGVLGSSLWQWLPSSGKQRSPWRKFRRFSEALRMQPQRRYLEWMSIFNEERRAGLYLEDFVERLPDSDPAGFLALAWPAKRDPVTAASLCDLVTYLPGDLLHKVDMAAMAHGLECRQPWLDWRLVELAAAMPVQHKYAWGRGKRILRTAFADLVPAAVWNRPKRGFGVPVAQWFRGELKPLVHDTLLDATARFRGYFRPEAVSTLVAEHERGAFDHSARLWSLLVFELWLRRWQKSG